MGLVYWALTHSSVILRSGRHSLLVRRLQVLHGLLRAARQQGSSTGIRGFAANDLVGDHCLIGVHSHVLHRDLLLPTTSMLIQSLGQQRYRSGGFVSQVQVFCMSLEIIDAGPGASV